MLQTHEMSLSWRSDEPKKRAPAVAAVTWAAADSISAAKDYEVMLVFVLIVTTLVHPPTIIICCV